MRVYHRRLDVSGFYTVCPGQGDRLDAGSCAHLKARIERFSDPADAVKFEPGRAVSIDGDDYQVVHAKIALARGGLFGKFPGHGQQRDFLPQAYSDFIYAIIIEEMGIVGGVFVLLPCISSCLSGWG